MGRFYGWKSSCWSGPIILASQYVTPDNNFPIQIFIFHINFAINNCKFRTIHTSRKILQDTHRLSHTVYIYISNRNICTFASAILFIYIDICFVNYDLQFFSKTITYMQEFPPKKTFSRYCVEMTRRMHEQASMPLAPVSTPHHKLCHISANSCSIVHIPCFSRGSPLGNSSGIRAPTCNIAGRVRLNQSAHCCRHQNTPRVEKKKIKNIETSLL